VDGREYLTADGRTRIASGWTHGTTCHGPYSGEGVPLLDRESRRPQERGGGVWEARVMFGPGYRIYFAKDGAQLVLLLLGGDKSTQSADVA
jgi:hypothetical protein